MLQIYLDPGFRRDDDMGINQTFLKWLYGLCVFARKIIPHDTDTGLQHPASQVVSQPEHDYPLRPSSSITGE
jgi:hypothetical protein